MGKQVDILLCNVEFQSDHLMDVLACFTTESKLYQTGRPEQVIEGMPDIRPLYSSCAVPLVAWREEKNDEDGLSEQILEIIDTPELTPETTASWSFAPSNIWDE